MSSIHEKRWKVFFLVGTSIFMSTLDSSIVNVALPYVMQDLGCGIQTVQWVVLSYLLTVSALLLTFGRLSDIQGRRRVYVFGFTIFSLGSILCGTAPGPGFLILSRVIQGCGAAMLMACSPALIVDVFPGPERGKALGMLGAVVASGLTTGPAVGGFILEYFSWRFIFYINIPIGIAAAIGGMVLLSDRQINTGSSEPMDKTGSFLLICGLTGLILFLTQIENWGMTSAASWICALVFLAAMTVFVMNEKRTPFPLFDMRLLKHRLFVYPVAAAAIIFACLFVIVFLMPFFLTYPCGFSAAKTGLVMIVPFLFLLFVSPVSGMLYDRWGSRRLCLAGMGAMALSLILLLSLEPSDSAWPVIWRIAFAGLGVSLYVSPNNTAVMSSVPPSRRGIASGTVATARNLGMMMGVTLAGLVFTGTFEKLSGGVRLENYQPDMQAFFMEGFRRAMVMGAVMAVLGLAVTWARGKETLSRDKNQDKGERYAEKSG